jgi:hypothetical protein
MVIAQNINILYFALWNIAPELPCDMSPVKTGKEKEKKNVANETPDFDKTSRYPALEPFSILLVKNPLAWRHWSESNDCWILRLVRRACHYVVKPYHTGCCLVNPIRL